MEGKEEIYKKEGEKEREREIVQERERERRFKKEREKREIYANLYVIHILD